MDKETEKAFIQEVKKRLEQINIIPKQGQIRSELMEERFLNQFLFIIEQKEKKIAMLEAKLEAETAVKDRFKELYVALVVDNTLKSEGVEV